MVAPTSANSAFTRILADALARRATVSELAQLIEEEVEARTQDRIIELRDQLEGAR